MALLALLLALLFVVALLLFGCGPAAPKVDAMGLPAALSDFPADRFELAGYLMRIRVRGGEEVAVWWARHNGLLPSLADAPQAQVTEALRIARSLPIEQMEPPSGG